MYDIWGFLLQTLTASSVALILIILKALFKDKLPPKWHFASWGVLGIILLVPAGLNGRYTVINWQSVIELIKIATEDFSTTQVQFPVPVISSMPHTLTDWLFLAYFTGIIIHLFKYLISHIRLRFILKKGLSASETVTDSVKNIAESLRIKPCRVIAVENLPSAFVCGIIKPVLAVPADENIDDKIILHELIHLKSKDTLWSVIICILRSIHWCNPLMIFCANIALNDMEYRCDQSVLERLEGEERRDYGRILLSMVNDRFTKTPCATCVNNGGKNIRNRIETIARFKKYPDGMKLVSVCMLIILTFSMITGVQSTAFYERADQYRYVSYASAKSTHCTTYAGAFDTYGKAILEQNGFYRIMCSPVSEHEKLYNTLVLSPKQTGGYRSWDSGIPAWPDKTSGYYVYNLTQTEKNVYEGMMVFRTNYPADGTPAEFGMIYVAYQNVRVQKENNRWVAVPLEEFRSAEIPDAALAWGTDALDGITYTATVENIKVDVKIQTIHIIDSTQQNQNDYLFGNNSYYDTTPLPNAEFTGANNSYSSKVTHLGTQKERDTIEQLGFSAVPVYEGESRPENMTAATGSNVSGSSSTGECWNSQTIKPGWGPEIEFGGGGSTITPKKHITFPEYYATNLYINNELSAQLDLHPEKEVKK